MRLADFFEGPVVQQSVFGGPVRLVELVLAQGAGGLLTPDDSLMIACWPAQCLTIPGNGWGARPPSMH